MSSPLLILSSLAGFLGLLGFLSAQRALARGATHDEVMELRVQVDRQEQQLTEMRRDLDKCRDDNDRLRRKLTNDN